MKFLWQQVVTAITMEGDSFSEKEQKKKAGDLIEIDEIL